ncbi:MAG TPA: glycosyltransferase [Solirubrobacteraceae bacterium]|jgi:glycosyltransferase involved in cell wall biosynthesis
MSDAPWRSGTPKVAVVAEFYPSQSDPVLGVWAHRQALAARDAGAEVRVLVLHRLVPPRASFADGPAGAASALRKLVREPRRQTHDGLEVSYVPYVSPPRSRSYASWGTWAAPALGLALRRLHRSFPFDLVHAHNAVPAGDAVRRARPGLHGRWAQEVPLLVSVHGGDVLYTAAAPPTGSAAGTAAVARGLGAARLVLANSQGIAELARAHGAGETRVVHLGADLPARPYSSRRTESPGRGGIAGARMGTIGIPQIPPPPTLVTVAHLVARKRHADVLRALAVLSPRHPTLRYEIIGEGPERVALEGLATRLGIAERVAFHGQLPPAEALAQARRCTLFVMPSTEEAFGVAYVEAMAGGLPAIGCRGEPGPEEIAAVGDGFMLVPPGDIERLSQRIDELLSDSHRLREASQRARATVAASFTWERCGEQTLAAYEHALRSDAPRSDAPQRPPAA